MGEKWDWKIGEMEWDEGEDWVVCVKNERVGLCVWNGWGVWSRGEKQEKKKATVKKIN